MKTFIAALIALGLASPVPRPPLFSRLAGHWLLQGTIGGTQVTHDVDADLVLNGEYIRMHEVSREQNASGAPAYEAIIMIGWDAKASEYLCLWLDSTSGEGLSNGVIARATPQSDRIPFVFKFPTGEVFRTTFIYDQATGSWRWTMDADEQGKLEPFGRVTLTRK